MFSQSGSDVVEPEVLITFLLSCLLAQFYVLIHYVQTNIKHLLWQQTHATYG